MVSYRSTTDYNLNKGKNRLWYEYTHNLKGHIYTYVKTSQTWIFNDPLPISIEVEVIYYSLVEGFDKNCQMSGSFLVYLDNKMYHRELKRSDNLKIF